jgi:hypothetical protein
MLRDDYIQRPALHGVAQAFWSTDSGDSQSQGSTGRPGPPPEIAKDEKTPTSRSGRGRFGRRCEREWRGLGRATKWSRAGLAGPRERSERPISRARASMKTITLDCRLRIKLDCIW